MGRWTLYRCHPGADPVVVDWLRILAIAFVAPHGLGHLVWFLAERTPAKSRTGLSRRERVALFIHRELDKRLTPLGVAVMRRTKGGITRAWKVDALLLTTTGRRTGKARTVVLQYFRDGDDMILVAANDGGASHPGWYYNLVAEPRARVEVMGRPIAVEASELPGEEAEAFWPRVLARSPDYERYTRATTRTFPIVRLRPVGVAIGPSNEARSN